MDKILTIIIPVYNTDKYLKLVCNMESNDIKAGYGRMRVYLPNCKIPFDSRTYPKSIYNLAQEKQVLSNISCSLLDKIWHVDAQKIFMHETSQVIYEDMEFVYFALAKLKVMFHSNDIVYNYCMRGLANNSTSAIGLQTTKSDAIGGLLSAAYSMRQKFIGANLEKKYHDELDAIIIKLVYQRIYNIITNSLIENGRTSISNIK